MKESKLDVVLLVATIVIVVLFGAYFIKDKFHNEQQISDLQQKVINFSESDIGQDEEIAVLKQQIEALEKENEKLSEELAGTFLTEMLIDNKKDYQNQLMLHNTEEEAVETAILFSNEDEYYFFLNYTEYIQIHEVTANGRYLPLTQNDNFSSFQYNLANDSDVMFIITYQYEDVIVSKYIKIIVRK